MSSLNIRRDYGQQCAYQIYYQKNFVWPVLDQIAGHVILDCLQLNYSLEIQWPVCQSSRHKSRVYYLILQLRRMKSDPYSQRGPKTLVSWSLFMAMPVRSARQVPESFTSYQRFLKLLANIQIYKICMANNSRLILGRTFMLFVFCIYEVIIN